MEEDLNQIEAIIQEWANGIVEKLTEDPAPESNDFTAKDQLTGQIQGFIRDLPDEHQDLEILGTAIKAKWEADSKNTNFKKNLQFFLTALSPEKLRKMGIDSDFLEGIELYDKA